MEKNPGKTKIYEDGIGAPEDCVNTYRMQS